MGRSSTSGRMDAHSTGRGLRAAVFATVALLALGVAPVAADTGGGHDDLGLDSITITSTAIDPQSGLVTIGGEIGCSQDVSEVFVGAGARQVVGRFHVLEGSGGASIECTADPGTASWSVSFYAYNGKFAPGPAGVAASAEVFVCGEEDCFFDFVETGLLGVRLGKG